jgi:hypothetical protein
MVAVSWTDAKLDVLGTKLHLSRAGKGPPVVVLHHETGTLDRLPFYDALAERYDVLVPHHPGYSRSERPDWMRSTPRDSSRLASSSTPRISISAGSMQRRAMTVSSQPASAAGLRIVLTRRYTTMRASCTTSSMTEVRWQRRRA